MARERGAAGVQVGQAGEVRGTAPTVDADADGDVDGADFVVWQTNFPFAPAPAASPVPEPGAFWLGVGLMAVIIARRIVGRSEGLSP